MISARMRTKGTSTKANARESRPNGNTKYDAAAVAGWEGSIGSSGGSGKRRRTNGEDLRERNMNDHFENSAWDGEPRDRYDGSQEQRILTYTARVQSYFAANKATRSEQLNVCLNILQNVGFSMFARMPNADLGSGPGRAVAPTLRNTPHENRHIKDFSAVVSSSAFLVVLAARSAPKFVTVPVNVENSERTLCEDILESHVVNASFQFVKERFRSKDNGQGNLKFKFLGKYGSSFKSAKFHVGADHKKAVELLVKQVVADAAQVAEEADDNFTIGMVLDTFLDCAKNLLDPETDAGKANICLAARTALESFLHHHNKGLLPPYLQAREGGVTLADIVPIDSKTTWEAYYTERVINPLLVQELGFVAEDVSKRANAWPSSRIGADFMRDVGTESACYLTNPKASENGGEKEGSDPKSKGAKPGEQTRIPKFLNRMFEEVQRIALGPGGAALRVLDEAGGTLQNYNAVFRPYLTASSTGPGSELNANEGRCSNGDGTGISRGSLKDYPSAAGYRSPPERRHCTAT